MPPTRIIRPSFTPALAWARTFLSPTKKPWTAGSGRTRCVTRMFPLQKRNRPFPVTERRLANRPDLSAGDRDALIVRLDRVRTISHNLGYGVGDDMDSLLVDHVGN